MLLRVALIIFGLLQIAWYSPRTSTNLTASMDVLASSTDSSSVGTSTNVWLNGYYRYMQMGETLTAPATVASFGQIFASTDGHCYYKNDAGTITQMDN